MGTKSSLLFISVKSTFGYMLTCLPRLIHRNFQQHYLFSTQLKMAVFLVAVQCVVWYKFTDVSEELAASTIKAMMEATCISETLVNFNLTTQCYNPDDGHLDTHCHKNLRSCHTIVLLI